MSTADLRNPAPHLKILVVEDDSAMGSMLRDFLVLEGYEVECLTDGVNAMNTLRRDPRAYSAVLSDVRMSPLDGLELLRLIKQEMPHLPVFLFTADTCEAEKKTALKLGAATYFAKPFPLSELASALKRELLR